jgi:hypothetical protein
MASFVRRAAVVSIVCGAALSAGAQEIVVPAGFENIEGANNNSWPFTTNSPISQRYQQVYGAGDFSAITGPHHVLEIRFRPNANSAAPAWSNTVTLDMRMSTTQAAPDALSMTFADNVGPDETVVYSGTATYSTMQATTSTGTGPMEFDVVITLQTPFVYDPALGNLLLEVRRDGATLTTSRFLDAHTAVGDSVSRVSTAAGGTSTSPVATLASSLGLITKFIMEPASGQCYANCDGSTTEPILNVADFTCFLTKFAAGNAYANCDGSTVEPVLNVADFTCFLTKFAGGC